MIALVYRARPGGKPCFAFFLVLWIRTLSHSVDHFDFFRRDKSALVVLVGFPRLTLPFCLNLPFMPIKLVIIIGVHHSFFRLLLVTDGSGEVFSLIRTFLQN